jgi:aryl-alcohol dehydrogenase-like predicted oxidoreductase
MTAVERREIAEGYEISRLIKGGWQLAGGHGTVDRAAAIADMGRYVAAGITTFDCADIYTGVEEMIGAFRRMLLEQGGAEALAGVRVHTKFVPDLDKLAQIDRAYVRRIIDRSLTRLGVERLDLVQFHWWDYTIPRYVETGLWLAELQREGKIALLGGTNWDTVRTAELLDAGVPLRTMQVQYSVLDARPEACFVPYCADHGILLLCYGTVAGGFLSERWLGAPEEKTFANRSLVKYKLIIDDIGGWAVFQRILSAWKWPPSRRAPSSNVPWSPGRSSACEPARISTPIGGCSTLCWTPRTMRSSRPHWPGGSASRATSMPWNVIARVRTAA